MPSTVAFSAANWATPIPVTVAPTNYTNFTDYAVTRYQIDYKLLSADPFYSRAVIVPNYFHTSTDKSGCQYQYQCANRVRITTEFRLMCSAHLRIDVLCWLGNAQTDCVCRALASIEL